MPRVKTKDKSGQTAANVLGATDEATLIASIKNILTQGGAVMFGQTRDNTKLIITVYLDGDTDKEYCEDANEAVNFLAQYQV